MELLLSILTGAALATDSFAVAMCMGGINHLGWNRRISIPLHFGVFQGAMLAAGYYLGSSAHDAVKSIDHWIAFVLLAGIGAKLLFDAYRGMEEPDLVSGRKLLLFSLATSIDALVAGFALSLTESDVLGVALITGIVTALMVGAGLFIGARIHRMRINYASVVGGVVLIGLGLKILVEHLLA